MDIIYWEMSLINLYSIINLLLKTNSYNKMIVILVSLKVYLQILLFTH